MTLKKALAMIRQLHPCAYDDEMLTRWLSELEGRIRVDIKGESDAGVPYSVDSDSDTELAAPFPHDGIYLTWLAAQIDYQNQEYERYNNEMIMFNSKWEDFAIWWMKTHSDTGGNQFAATI